MTCDIGPVPQVSVSTKRCGFQSREQARRQRSGTEPSHHLNVVLSKAALSGPSVCLRARAPCPLRVSCPVTDRAQSAQLCAPSRIARARSPAARSRASCGSLGQDKPVSPPHTRPAQELQRHQGRHEPVGKVQCDDDPFIVLTEIKFSFRCIPVWIGTLLAGLGSKKRTHVIMFSP